MMEGLKILDSTDDIEAKRFAHVSGLLNGSGRLEEVSDYDNGSRVETIEDMNNYLTDQQKVRMKEIYPNLLEQYKASKKEVPVGAKNAYQEPTGLEDQAVRLAEIKARNKEWAEKARQKAEAEARKVAE